MYRFLVLVFFIFLTACADETVYAPVTELSTIEPLPRNGIYHVKPDDTLYSIAWRYGMDYRSLAKINNISRPYHIETGQAIRLREKNAKPSEKISQPAPKIHPVVTEKEPVAPVSYWRWPAQGKVTEVFNGRNKGINIAGQLGDPIYAAAPGKVVYSGNGLRAYGNLIIIKHNSSFLSAYAYNKEVLVHEGEWVKAGQKIATMGRTNTNRVMLHFEIRQNGKPVNPIQYLGK